jgi:hypothetical protein
MTLRLSDFRRSGWTIAQKQSTELDKPSDCTYERGRRFITGYSDGAVFTSDAEYFGDYLAASQGAVFTTPAAAQGAFRWVTGSRYITCLASLLRRSWKLDRVVSKGRESFRPTACGLDPCPFVASAWRVLAEKADSKLYIHGVVLRIDRAVAMFMIVSVNTPSSGKDDLVVKAGRRGK